MWNKIYLESHEDRIDHVNFIPVTTPDGFTSDGCHTPYGMLWTAQSDYVML